LLTVRVPGIFGTAIREAKKRLSGAAEVVKGLAAPRVGGRKRNLAHLRYFSGTPAFVTDLSPLRW